MKEKEERGPNGRLGNSLPNLRGKIGGTGVGLTLKEEDPVLGGE